MARSLRIEFAGAFYHVTARGNQRSTIFIVDDDRRKWLELIAQVADRFHWRVFAYCQMGNHFHLLVQTPEPNLSRCLRHLNGVYTQRFNRHHRRCGHLPQGRYHAVLVDQDSYLMEVTRYVLLNPVRARMVPHPGNWAWSSYQATIGVTQSPPWLAVNELLSHFSSQTSTAVAAFERFVIAGLNAESPWRELNRDIYLGDEHFIAESQLKIEIARRNDGEIPRPQRSTAPATLDQWFITESTVAAAVIAAYRSGNYTMRQIADHVGVHYSTISRLLARIESRNA